MRKLLLIPERTQRYSGLAVRLGISEVARGIPARYKRYVSTLPAVICEKGETVFRVIHIPESEVGTFTFDFSTIPEPRDSPRRQSLLEQLREEIASRELVTATLNEQIVALRADNDSLWIEIEKLKNEPNRT